MSWKIKTEQMKKAFKKYFKNKKAKKMKNMNPVPQVDAVFELKYKKLLIGTLKFDFSTEKWIFSYSEDFKSQNKIDTLLLFPETDKIYESKELWPFFLSRIPDNTNKAKIDKEKANNSSLIELLKSYGQRTITNPFDLSFT